MAALVVAEEAALDLMVEEEQLLQAAAEPVLRSCFRIAVPVLLLAQQLLI